LRVQALDEAVARCPGLAVVRWARFDDRLARGDIDGAFSDAEHLEAAAAGNRARHDVCIAAASRALGAGYQRDAGRLFERALRYVPDDPSATAGLARSLIELGRPNRALVLLERAIALGEKGNAPEIGAIVDLAKLLAKMGDLPQAIARARQVTTVPARVEARALEADWRAKLGDVAGASLAFGRMREAVELGEAVDTASAVEWLRNAASFEKDVRDDAVAAERHLAVAIRLAPRDRAVAEAYREIAGVVASRSRRRDEPT
jgi:tetratricopeptide (TPR) repeat protein